MVVTPTAVVVLPAAITVVLHVVEATAVVLYVVLPTAVAVVFCVLFVAVAAIALARLLNGNTFTVVFAAATAAASIE